VSELKALQATSLSTFNASLRETFKLLNIHRQHTGIENYGQVKDLKVFLVVTYAF